jgi:SAM-dependent methyltransferase
MANVGDLERRYYPGYEDEHVRFDRVVRRHLCEGMVVLDAGAGRGVRSPYDYARIARRLVGADLNPAVGRNANLTGAVVADLGALPFRNGTFDLAFSKYVFEHLDRPLPAMRELRRVLVPGSHLLIHTPNRWHYVALAAMVTPGSFHRWFNERRGREGADTYPTRYRANDRRTIERMAAATGFRVTALDLFETKPDYLFFSRLLYRAGIAYERAVNRWDALAGLRVQLIADLEAV